MQDERRSSLIGKLFRRNNASKTPSTGLDQDTQSTTGLIQPPNSVATAETRTITLPLTGGGVETIVVPNDLQPRDPQNSDPERWKFHQGSRKASVAAADTGDKAAHASDVEKAQFASIMEQTKGMNEQQVREFLQKRGVVDGGKVMRRWEDGKGGDGYMQLTGGDRGAF